MLTPILSLLPILPLILAHGQVHTVITHDPVATYVAADAYAAANPSSPIRKLNTYGPADPFTGPDITCGPGGNVPVPNLAPVKAGSQVTISWNPWNSVHPGPIMTYIARCPNGCASFKGDTGSVWIKIDHDGYNPNRAIPWAEENILQYQTYTVTIPASLAPGEYLLRHEILGLHVASQLNGAQFYPNCIQISVTGSGSTIPSGGIALPGAYQPTDPGILVQLYTITPTSPAYQIPGGPILYNGGAGYYGNSAVTIQYSSGVVPPPASTSSSPTKTTSTSSAKITSSSTTTSSASGPAQTAYGQCGGQSWTGATTCVSGYTCKYSNAYYSQCLPS